MSVGASAAAGAGTAAGAGGAAATGAQPAGSGAGAPAANAGASGSAAAGAASGQNQAAGGDWTSGLNDELRGYTQNKGWRGPQDVVDSYRNFEKLMGAPQDRILKLPDESDAAGWEAVHMRLGRPPNPEGYKIELPKEGGDPDFAKWASGEFFKAGLSEKQGKTVVEAWNKRVGDMVAAHKQQHEAKVAASVDGLRKEWGAAYDNNVSAAKRTMREFGLKNEAIDALERSTDFMTVMKVMHTIGSKLGEGTFHTGGSAANDNAPMAPAQAAAQIKALRADPGFTKKYLEGDAEARAKMDRLHQWAHPEMMA